MERELGAHITEDYLLVKFWNQFDEIKWYKEEEKKEHDRHKRKI